MAEGYDFSGWATKNNLLCSDGRTILRDAFKDNDGKTVPLVWNHQHSAPENVLGHALLENRTDGVYAYCTFNDSETGKIAKILVEHGDIESLSIYANHLKQRGKDVQHGVIREVSLVLAGANPGAYIESVMKHGEECDDEAWVFTGEEISIAHADENKEEKEVEKEKTTPKSDDEETVADVFNTLTEKQKNVVFALIGDALSENNNNDSEEEKTVKHNVFDNDEHQEEVLMHADFEAIKRDLTRYGSLRDAVRAHDVTDEQIMHAVTDSAGNSVTYGIADIDYLFPEARSLNTPPAFISRDMAWVSVVMNGVHHTPFSRIKSMFANITEADARAKGYVKGNMKVEEVFGLLKRITTPTTIYKKQKLDRDDINDITDFDVVAWLKGEMRMMLNEEIARAILVGDGRNASSDDKINEQNIRPIWTDDDLYTIKQKVSVSSSATDDQIAKAMIRAAVKCRKDYKGSGNPVLFTTEDYLTDILLMEDTQGHRLYDSIDKAATAMRVSRIVTVPVMENLSRSVTTSSGTETRYLMGLIVNLTDYNVGADKGGAVSMFEDFDIDYNQQKYLIETRCSGAMTVPYAAIALEKVVA